MYLIRASAPEHAQQIAASDPYRVKGDSKFELTQWIIRQIMGIGPFIAGLGLDNRGPLAALTTLEVSERTELN